MTAVDNNQVPRYPIGFTIYLFVSLWKILFLLLNKSSHQVDESSVFIRKIRLGKENIKKNTTQKVFHFQRPPALY